MKKLLVVLLVAIFVCPLVTIAQENSASTVWVVHHLTPKQVDMKAMIKRIAEHDKKYHEGKSVILSVMTGDDSGDILWAYGPSSYTDLDNWNTPKGHDEDNMALNKEYVDEYHSMTMWKLQPDLTVDFGDEVENYAMRNHTSIKLKAGAYQEWSNLVKKHIAVWKEHKLGEVSVYNAVYGTKDGHDVLVIAPFKNFASFDEDRKYKEKFEAMHGAGSLQITTDRFNELTVDDFTFMVMLNSKE